MTRQELIDFLSKKEKDSGGLVQCWKRTFANSDDYWYLFKPAVDWFEDDIELTENKVILTYDKDLLDDKRCNVDEYSFEEFAGNIK